MKPHGKLVTANILMLVGIVPLMVGISWILAVILYAQQHKGEMGGSDAFLMIAVLIVTYAFAARREKRLNGSASYGFTDMVQFAEARRATGHELPFDSK